MSESLHTKHGRCPPQVTMTAVWQPRGKAHGRVSMAAGLLKASLHDSLSGLTTTAHRRSTASSSAYRCKCPPERFSTGDRPVSPRRGWPCRDTRGHHSWGRAWALGGRRRARCQRASTAHRKKRFALMSCSQLNNRHISGHSWQCAAQYFLPIFLLLMGDSWA